ncbi:uncharacterized protein LOC117115682, partial [Anneissia japonica]|uniref:uncharacterized protein LOC117115682 n=1 Tax=Anneissia japonica TaxID=1529436 RepID=UPI00142594AC
MDADTLKCFNSTYFYTVYLKSNNGEGVGDVVYQGIDTKTAIYNINVDATYVILITVSNKDSEGEFSESHLVDHECETGFFGENCEEKCTKPCMCHRLTGKCVSCYSNWLEPNCEI